MLTHPKSHLKKSKGTKTHNLQHVGRKRRPGQDVHYKTDNTQINIDWIHSRYLNHVSKIKQNVIVRTLTGDISKVLGP